MPDRPGVFLTQIGGTGSRDVVAVEFRVRFSGLGSDPVAQLDRAWRYERRSRGCNSYQERLIEKHFLKKNS